MKSLFVFLVLCTCVPALVTATSSDPLLTHTTITDQYIGLTLANLEQERTVVTITNLVTEEEVYREMIKRHNGFAAQFDCAALPDGRYVITVVKGEITRRQIILKQAGTVLCSDWS